MWQFMAFVSEGGWSIWVTTHCFHVVVKEPMV